MLGGHCRPSRRHRDCQCGVVMRMQKDKVGSKVGRMGIERHPREVREFHLSLELELWSIHQRDLRATSISFSRLLYNSIIYGSGTRRSPIGAMPAMHSTRQNSSPDTQLQHDDDPPGRRNRATQRRRTKHTTIGSIDRLHATAGA